MNKIIVIVGPTGVGKTKLSIELAKKLDAEIINGDSVSIYRKLDIGSAKPSFEERENIVHHLIDVKDVFDDYTIYDYQKDARDAIKDIISRGKNVIIVGGTGLYIKSVLYDYKFHDENVLRYDTLETSEIIDRIKKYGDFDIDYSNRRRVVRLLSKLENNLSIEEEAKLIYPSLVIGLTTPRDNLYNIINRRIDNMISNGLLDEIKSLKDYYDRSRVLNSAIGYKEFNSYINDEDNLENVIETIKKDSRKYAKRQMTYFKHQLDTRWFNTDYDNFQNTIEEVLEYVKDNFKFEK